MIYPALSMRISRKQSKKGLALMEFICYRGWFGGEIRKYKEINTLTSITNTDQMAVRAVQ